MSAGFILQFASSKFLYYCDTGPVDEKVWAQRAGIGWIGKHTNVINREIGSWVFLAEVITDLECEPDCAGVDHCGSCRNASMLARLKQLSSLMS